MELPGIPEHHLPTQQGSPGLGTAAKVYVLRECGRSRRKHCICLEQVTWEVRAV